MEQNHTSSRVCAQTKPTIGNAHFASDTSPCPTCSPSDVNFSFSRNPYNVNISKTKHTTFQQFCRTFVDSRWIGDVATEQGDFKTDVVRDSVDAEAISSLPQRKISFQVVICGRDTKTRCHRTASITRTSVTWNAWNLASKQLIASQSTWHPVFVSCI